MSLACLLFALPACQNENTAEPSAPVALGTTSQPDASNIANTATDPTAAAPPTPPQYEMPVPADFQEEAEKTITKANYKAELLSLEAEIK
jgi:hypothetical protein